MEKCQSFPQKWMFCVAWVWNGMKVSQQWQNFILGWRQFSVQKYLARVVKNEMPRPQQFEICVSTEFVWVEDALFQ